MAGTYPVRIDMQPVAGSTSSVRFEVYLPDELMQMPGTLVNYSLSTPGASVGVQGAEAIQVSQNSFQGEAVFPLPGRWNLELQIARANEDLLSATKPVDIPAQPLVKDLRTYLSYSAIAYSRSNLITFTTGLLLLLTYGWLTWQGRSGRTPPWTAVGGLAGVTFGIYLVFSIILVKTYPSTYWTNPESYTATSISRGQAAYQEHCAECHGNNGRGDGPWAVENRGLIPSISSPHMDIHTDGEIYWWITNGIPSLEMPALEDAIPEPQRWSIINYIRSLRHGIPPAGSDSV
jgi:mono/diheme cytochrome c family protein